MWCDLLCYRAQLNSDQWAAGNYALLVFHAAYFNLFHFTSAYKNIFHLTVHFNNWTVGDVFIFQKMKRFCVLYSTVYFKTLTLKTTSENHYKNCFVAHPTLTRSFHLLKPILKTCAKHFAGFESLFNWALEVRTAENKINTYLLGSEQISNISIKDATK